MYCAFSFVIIFLAIDILLTERDGDTPVVETTAKASSPTGSTIYSPGTSGSGTTLPPVNQEPSAFDEFDPRSFAPGMICMCSAF